MSIFRDFVAGFEQFDRDATGLRATRVVIGDDGTFQTAKGEIMSDEDTAVAMEPKPTTGLKTPIVLASPVQLSKHNRIAVVGFIGWIY